MGLDARSLRRLDSRKLTGIVADPESLIPIPCGAIDADRMRTMPLAPTDGFLLSRIDGTTSVADLAQATGITVEEVIASLIKLESLRLVELPKAPKSSRPPRSSRPPKTPRPKIEAKGHIAPPPRPPPARSPQPMLRASPPPRTPSPPPRSAPQPPLQPSPLPPPGARSPSRPVPGAPFTPVPNLDLAPEHQQQIATLFAQLETLDLYALLGVERGVDKKAIKRSYFELTSKFHPDRFFRKEIGPFKAQMEAIFGRMTEAHDTLTDAARRADYDAYIGSVERTRSIERMVAEATAEMRRAEEVARGVTISSIPPPPSSHSVDSSSAPSQPQSVPPSRAGETTGAFSRESPSGKMPVFPKEAPTGKISVFPPESPTAVSAKPSARNLGALIGDALTKGPSDRTPSGNRISIPVTNSQAPDAQNRREMLARRLTGNRPSAQFGGSKAPPIAYAKTEDAVDSLKRRYEEKVSAARTGQARKYTDTGMESLAKGDVVAAANSLRVALTFDGDNPELKVAYDKAQRASDQLLGDQYLKQADYEEKAEKWADAARSWRRVARAREDDVKAHERAAHCLVKAAGNLHEAAALAQRAVLLAPKSAPVRLTLANVYLAAGLTLNARRELESAAQLAPDDANIASLLKRIAKSD